MIDELLWSSNVLVFRRLWSSQIIWILLTSRTNIGKYSRHEAIENHQFSYPIFERRLSCWILVIVLFCSIFTYVSAPSHNLMLPLFPGSCIYPYSEVRIENFETVLDFECKQLDLTIHGFESTFFELASNALNTKLTRWQHFIQLLIQILYSVFCRN